MPETLVVLVSGRGALATLAGVPSVERHARAGKALGLEVVVVFPPERRALGAEIRGLVEENVSCMPADQLAAALPKSPDSRGPLVVAAEWYLSLAAIASVRDLQSPRAFGRVCERGCLSVPVARVTNEEAASVALQLGTASAAATLARLADAGSVSIQLDSHSEQRLSDNVSTAHAEEKLVAHLFGPQRILPVLRLRPTLAPLIARRLGGTALGPAGISAMKLAIGLAAAWIIEGGSYADGFVGALLYFVARLVGASGNVLARASLSDDDIREKLELAGDTVLHVALLWSLAGGPARGNGAVALAAIATAGVLISTAVAYIFVVREAWEARRREVARHGHDASAQPAAPSNAFASAGDEFVSRCCSRPPREASTCSSGLPPWPAISSTFSGCSPAHVAKTDPWPSAARPDRAVFVSFARRHS